MNIDINMKDTSGGVTDEAFVKFAERMTSDNEFRSDTLMMTVALMIRNIQAIEAKVKKLEEAVARITGQEMGGEE